MRAKIKSEFTKLFNPFYNTVIGGVPTQVSLKDVESNPDKYIKTPVAPLYENHKELAQRIANRQAAVEFESLDMQTADVLGDIFDPQKRDKKKNEIAQYLELQKTRRAKIERKAKAKLATKRKGRPSKKAQDAAAKKAQDEAQKTA